MRRTEQFTILITGATDGLGERVATDLAGLGFTLLLHGRNPDKGRQVLARIREATGNDRLHYFNADLSSLAEVNRLAVSVGQSRPRLDVLINNAGLGAGPDSKLRETSVDGYELRFAVNYLAPFLLTRRLLPLLCSTSEKAGQARIVNVASVAQQAIDFSDVFLEKKYDGMRAYGQSKLALIMFTFDLGEELAGTGVTANSLHPASLMDTRMVREWFGYALSKVETGAHNVERLVLADELREVSGVYFDHDQPARAASQAYDMKARQKLRDLSLIWTGFDL